MTIDLDAAQALSDAAPKVEVRGDRIEGGSSSCGYCNRTFTFNFMRDHGPDVCDCRNSRVARFYAAARTLVPELIAKLRIARAMNDNYREVVAEQQAQLADLQARLDEASEECQRHQVGESYQVGHEYGSAVAVKYRDERGALRTQLDAVLAEHAKDEDGFCSTCVQAMPSGGLKPRTYPCPAVRAATGDA